VLETDGIIVLALLVRGLVTAPALGLRGQGGRLVLLLLLFLGGGLVLLLECLGRCGWVC
jgi:hypothetical protein